MNWLHVLLVVLSSFCFTTPSFADESCECAKSICAPCEVEAGTTFYSAKCGPQNSRVKSCKKTTCQPVENQKQCLAQLKPGGAESVSGVASEVSPRQVANLAAEAGQIVDLQGEYSVTHSNGITEKPRKRDPAFVGDLFETRADSSVKITLQDGSEVSVAPNSKLKIEKVEVDASALKRQVAMMVLSGRVRNKVKKNYRGENSYQVRTPAAVAGVRGTDFITSYVEGEHGWVSEVRTVEGLVRLSSQGAETSRFIDIPPGTYAILNFEGGREKLSPLFKMKAEELRRLEINDFLADATSDRLTSAQRSIASVATDTAEPICSAPAGAYNQCSFSCENNPKGEKSCRTDLPDVACVRRICRANGQWADLRRLPASESNHCDPKGAVVKECGQYW